ncbi:MAG: EamA family transporter [Bacteroidales bacterium]|nr:EamA family transporter [Bacteroidales bacterium]
MIGATILFGVNYWVAKGLMPDYLSPFQIIFIRIAGAGLIFWLFDLLNPNHRAIPPVKILIKLFLLALLGIALNQTLFFIGLNLTSPVDTSIINSTNPLLVLLISLLITKSLPSKYQILGIISGMIGAIILIAPDNYLSHSSSITAGNWFILANTICWSLYLVLGKTVMSQYGTMYVMKWIFLFGFVLISPFTIDDFLSIDISSFSTKAWFSLIYVVIGTTFLAYMLITIGLKSMPPQLVAVYTNLQPVIVVLIGFTITNEGAGVDKLFAMLMVILGIFLVSRR